MYWEAVSHVWFFGSKASAAEWVRGTVHDLSVDECIRL